jgi:hypothetical protein
LKLRVGSKNKFDQWKLEACHKVLSRYGEDTIRLIDIQKLVGKHFDDDIREIDVRPEMKVVDVIVLLTGHEPLTIKELEKGSLEITESYLYCLSASSKELEPSAALSSYDIQNDDLLLLGVYTKVEPDLCSYRAALIRDIDDFCRIVRTSKDIDNSPGLLFVPRPIPKGATDALVASIMVGSMFKGVGLRPIESVLLYTDEDVSIAEYIRYNFAALDEMTGHHLNIYTIEEPTSVQGISANRYWQLKLEKTKYDFLHLMGWTQSKPYDKNQSYKIARILGVYPDSLPCIVFFGDIKSDEKVVVTITGDEKEFFRKISSIALKSCESIVSSESSSEFNFSNFQNEFMELWKACKAEKNKQQAANFVFNGKTVFINKARVEQMKNVEVEMSFNAAVIGATGKNEGVININISEQKQTLAEAAAEIQRLLKQLEETNPTATEPEQVAYVNVGTKPELKQRAVAALKAGGETAIDEFFLENKYLKVGKAIVKGWLQPNS